MANPWGYGKIFFKPGALTPRSLCRDGFTTGARKRDLSSSAVALAIPSRLGSLVLLSNKEMATVETLDMSKPETPSTPSCSQLFWVFTRIALTSFGGGLSGWLLREFVQNRKWMTQEEFLNGLSISQALPGVNVKNMAVWIGYRFHGWRGAVVGFVGIIVPPAFVIVLLATLFSSLSGYALTHVVLTGAAAAAVGLSLSMGITAARAVPRNAIPITIMAGTFVAVAIMHWPLFWVVLAAGLVGVASAYAKGRADE